MAVGGPFGPAPPLGQQQQQQARLGVCWPEAEDGVRRRGCRACAAYIAWHSVAAYGSIEQRVRMAGAGMPSAASARW